MTQKVAENTQKSVQTEFDLLPVEKAALFAAELLPSNFRFSLI